MFIASTVRLLLLNLSLVVYGYEGEDKAHRFSGLVGMLTLLINYCSVFFNPLIYLLRYNVVRNALISFVRRYRPTANFSSSLQPAVT